MPVYTGVSWAGSAAASVPGGPLAGQPVARGDDDIERPVRQDLARGDDGPRATAGQVAGPWPPGGDRPGDSVRHDRWRRGQRAERLQH